MKRSIFVKLSVLAVGLGALGAAGCDSLTGEDASPPETALAGLYTVDSWTDNEAGCDEEGPSSGDALLWPRFGVNPDANDLIGLSWVLAFACSDEDNCARRQDDGAVIGLLVNGWRLVEGDDAAGWRGTRDGAYREQDDDSCTGFRTTATLTGTAQTSARLEARHEFVSWDDENTGGPCDSDEVAGLVTGTCDRLEVITATYDEPLPPVPADD